MIAFGWIVALSLIASICSFPFPAVVPICCLRSHSLIFSSAASAVGGLTV
jgi:hypothetical protein